MSSFDEYKDKFLHLKMRRDAGILEVRVHTDEGPLYWGPRPHDELAMAFRAIAQDMSIRVMILTGTGDSFSGPRASDVDTSGFHSMPADEWESFHAHGMELMDSLLSIQAPVIGAVNGPALRHCELPLMSDIVICSDTATFQDSAHFPDVLTPGDGINVLTPLIMGRTRSHYFHLMGQVLHAETAHQWGLVNEVMPAETLMDRAWEIARQLARQRPMILRHTRLLFTQDLRKQMIDMVGYGLALEGLDVADAHSHTHNASGHRD